MVVKTLISCQNGSQLIAQLSIIDVMIFCLTFFFLLLLIHHSIFLFLLVPFFFSFFVWGDVFLIIISFTMLFFFFGHVSLSLLDYIFRRGKRSCIKQLLTWNMEAVQMVFFRYI